MKYKIGEVIANHRKNKKLSQIELAEKLAEKDVSVTNAAISAWEKGNSMPTAESLLAVCEILEINDIVAEYLKPRLENDFGVNMKAIDISAVEPDKESEGYQELRNITATQQTKTVEAQTEINLKNMQDSQRINAENMEETLRVQREEAQRAQRLQTENQFIGAHALNKQTEVLSTAASNLGEMGQVNLGSGNGGAMNPAGMMMGMAMGGAMGGQMGNMINQMGQAQQQSMQQNQQTTPPPVPCATASYLVAVNGQQFGPFNIQQLQQMVQTGQLTSQTYVWKQGMANWEFAGNMQELSGLFGTVPPPIPPMP